MIKKLHDKFNLETVKTSKGLGLLTPILIILLYLGGVSDVHGANGSYAEGTEDVKNIAEDLPNQPKIVKSYAITDASTEGKSCFPTKGQGVIFQRAAGCEGLHHIWRVKDQLIMNEYDDNTASIIGYVIDDNGKIGEVNITLYDKESEGSTWSAQCYLEGISDPRSLYQSFNGTITVDGNAYTVEKKTKERHFILAEGAGFEQGKFGFGAWTAGSFGDCTEWFGNLDPIEVDCDLSVDAGEDQTICENEEITLTAVANDNVYCSEIISSYKITDASTVDKSCFPTKGEGVVFQRGDGCIGDHQIWKAGDQLILNEYADDTARITGTVVDQNGRIGDVNILLYDKNNQGKTWPAKCYLEGIADDPRIFYQSFKGTITVDGEVLTVELKASEQHYIIADGAGFDSAQYGLGAWTGGTFGACTEWFGNLEAIAIEDPNVGLAYQWSTGETTESITVTEPGDYTVTVTNCLGCVAEDTVSVIIEEKVVIGDFVWLDENQNGLQDDGATGINGVKVTLYQCNGDEVSSTFTADNTVGESGAYSFEVCPNSGEYYVVFGDIPEELQFATSDAGDDALDSDANENGRTPCFEIADIDNFTIDAGLSEICVLSVDAGEEVEICEGEVIEITASIDENNEECAGACVYPILEQERCYGPDGDFEVYLVSTGHVDNFKFKASEQRFERLADGSARYTATASNGKDVIKVDARFTGYTSVPPVGSPKQNACQEYDTSDWEYWTTWSGTIISENHGTFNLSVKVAAFQMGNGADMTRTGFGASGWFYVDGGDGFYSEGDINVTIKECIEEGMNFKWTTEDGNIVGLSNLKTISVDQAGTYKVEAINCIDCVDTDTIVVTKGSCSSQLDGAETPKLSNLYPMPVQSGSTLTVQFDIPKTADENTTLEATSLKTTANFPERQEDVTVMLHDMTGRTISIPRIFKMVDGKATIYLDLDYIPSGKYILRAQGLNWSDSKHVLVK